MQKKFKIGGMSCSACSAAVERAVGALEGVKRAEVNLLAGTMICEYDEGRVSAGGMIKAVKKAGYTARADGAEESAEREETDALTPVKTRLIVSIIFLVLLMYVSMGHMLGVPLPAFLLGEQNSGVFVLTQLFLTLPVIYANRKFYINGFGALARRAPNMDTLIAVGSSSALIYGAATVFTVCYALGRGELSAAGEYAHNLYFESAAMILTLVTVGKLLEERAKNKAGDAVRSLMDLSPKTSRVIRDGAEVEIPSSQIVVGDTVVIRPGDVFPADGVVIHGASTVDEAAITGESMPRDKREGDEVISATVNKSGLLHIRAQKVGDDTMLAAIIKLVEQAGASKAPVAKLADRIAGVFVPIVMALALITFAVWLAVEGIGFALSCGISVLVISCPCALGLATPVAVTVAIGSCAKRGILIKSAEALQNVRSADTVVLDKTGTLTKGIPAVYDAIPYNTDRDRLAAYAASVEGGSAHPLAHAVTAYAACPLPECVDFREIPGRGVEGTVDGELVRGGNRAFMQECGIDISAAEADAERLSSEGKTVMFFSLRDKLLGLIACADEIRETSAEAVVSLKKNGLEVVMLTGDNIKVAQAMSKKLGIDSCIAEVLPQDKEREIARLQKEGRRVIMAGDGINDSPALSRADIGIAMGGGADIAAQSADIVLLGEGIGGIVYAYTFSRRTMRIIKQNLFWAFIYNVICIPVAAGVLFLPLGLTLSPMLASAAMSVSSLFVVLNALRLRIDKKDNK